MTVQVSVKHDIAKATKGLDKRLRKQVPFATAMALTRTAANAMATERDNIQREQQAPVGWTVRSLRFERASKANLQARVYVHPRAVEYLKYTVRSRRTKRARNAVLMVPVGLQRLGGRGRVLNRRLAHRYRERLLAQRTHFEGGIRGTNGIWKRHPDGRVELMVLYIDQAEYSGTWRFYSNVQRSVSNEFPGQFRLALAHAIRTAR